MRPKAHAHRAGSVLLAMLLLMSMVAAPIGTGTVAAQDDTMTCLGAGDDGYNPAAYLLGSSCAWTVSETDTSGDQAVVQTDLHAMARSEYETEQMIRTLTHNYQEDAPTLASLEARHAIATAYENGSTAEQADVAAQEAIQNYYSDRLNTTLEAYTKQQAQFAYIGSADDQDNVHDDFINAWNEGGWFYNSTYEDYYVSERNVTGELVSYNHTLPNGEVKEYKTAEHYWHAHNDSGNSDHWHSFGMNFEDYRTVSGQTGDGTDYRFQSRDGHEDMYLQTSGDMLVTESYRGTGYDLENGQPAQVVSEFGHWVDAVDKWHNQSQRVESNYPSGTAQQLFDAMDNGTIDPAEVRGAEGQVRYLSGDSNVTDRAFEMALFSTLDIDSPDLTNASTMLIHYDGATSMTYNDSADIENRSAAVEFGDYVNETYQGLLFAQEAPNGSFDIGTTYNTSDLNGSAFIHTDNGSTVHMYSGEFEVLEMYDQDGNSVDSTEWDTGPDYESWSVEDFVQYLEDSKDQRTVIIESTDDTTAGGGGIDWWPDWDTDIGGSSVIAGLVIIVAAAVSVVLLATNVFRP